MAARTFPPNSVLPPISRTERTAGDPDEAILFASKDKLRVLSQHLIDEVLSAEVKSQSLLDDLWSEVKEKVEKEKIKFKKKLGELNSKLEATESDLKQSKKNESALVNQQNQMSIELIAEKKERGKAVAELKSVQGQLSTLMSRIGDADSSIQIMKDTVATSKNLNQSDLDAKTKIISDNQEKIKKLCDTVQCIQMQLKNEKDLTKKLQQQSDGETAKKLADNKKFLSENTKLKNQLRTSNSSLTETQDELQKLRLQLKQQQELVEKNIGVMNKQHAAVTKPLHKKIETLEQEIATLRLQFQIQIESLKQQLVKAGQDPTDHFLEDRIRFLTHQNRKEKDKIHGEVKNVAL